MHFFFLISVLNSMIDCFSLLNSWRRKKKKNITFLHQISSWIIILSISSCLLQNHNSVWNTSMTSSFLVWDEKWIIFYFLYFFFPLIPNGLPFLLPFFFLNPLILHSKINQLFILCIVSFLMVIFLKYIFAYCIPFWIPISPKELLHLKCK